MKEPTEKGQKTWVLALTSVASLMVALDALVVTTALSTIIETLQRTMNAYNLSFAVLLLTGAALGDRFGRRRTFVAGLGLFVAASAACVLAGSAGWLIAARAVQGAGAVLVMPLAIALLSAAFPPHVARQGARDLQWLDRAGSLNPLGTRGFGASEGERLR